MSECLSQCKKELIKKKQISKAYFRLDNIAL